MKILSWNVNGLRAAYKRNFLKWLKSVDADFICLQEIKAQKEKLPDELLNIDKYHAFFNFAQKPGYSGVAIYAKQKPAKTEYKLGLKRFDQEGRIIALTYPGFSLINVYLPHGGRGKENLVYKLEVYKFLINYLKKLKAEPKFYSLSSSKGKILASNPSTRSADGLAQGINRPVIIIGDFNIAHTALDLARPKQNQNNIMFTLEERAQIDALVELGFTDIFRMFHKGGENYTWWPYFANARARNLGWRIDYCFTSKSLAPKVKKAFILSDVFGSDHCPIGVEI